MWGRGEDNEDIDPIPRVALLQGKGGYHNKTRSEIFFGKCFILITTFIIFMLQGILQSALGGSPHISRSWQHISLKIGPIFLQCCNPGDSCSLNKTALLNTECCSTRGTSEKIMPFFNVVDQLLCVDQWISCIKPQQLRGVAVEQWTTTLKDVAEELESKKKVS